MEELGRYIRKLFSDIVYQLRDTAIEATEQKVRETVNQQLDQLQKPKQDEQAQDDRK